MNPGFTPHYFDFIEHLKVKNYSRATIESYSQGARDLFSWLSTQGISDIRKVTKPILIDYHLHLAEQKQKTLSLSTLSVRIRAVKRLFEFLELGNKILINPAESIKEPRKEKRFPRVILTPSEVTKILDQPNLSTRTGIRDRTVLEIFYSTGIRLEEMTKLTIYDIDLKGGLLRVNKGKFAKDRVIPLGKHAVRFLKEYITKIRPHHTKKNRSIRTLFVNQSGGALGKQVIGIKIRGYARSAKIQKHVTAHTFRHTFATELVKNGADIRAVQKMLGHSDLSVTHIYVKVAGAEIQKTHQRHHPRERDKAFKEEIKTDITSIRGRYGQNRP